MSRLIEKYRPKAWSEVAGHEAAIAEIRESVAREGWGGRAWWIVGTAGTGCTSIANVLARDGADDGRIRSVGGDGVDTAMTMRIASENPGKEASAANRAYIIDRPAWIAPEPARVLSCALPALHKNICVIFTMPTESEKEFLSNPASDIELRRSCRRIELADLRDLEEPFAKRCREIAEQEGFGGKELSYYITLARRHQCRMRAMLSAVGSETATEEKGS